MNSNVSPYLVDPLPLGLNCYRAIRQTGHFVSYRFKIIFSPSIVKKNNKLEAGTQKQ